VATADAHPRAGAIGSLVLFPDGRIQEAGAVIWSDGSTWPVGRNLPGDSTEWHFVRRVDYVSACSMLVTRTAWNDVGGFDVEFHPGYYEDTDLCLALRERGYEVLIEPRSRLWHHESASSDQRFKQFLFSRNHLRLRKKWAAALMFQEPPQPPTAAVMARAVWRARGVPPRVLIVDDRLPESSLGAGFGRMHTAVMDLARSGYAVSIYPTAGVAAPMPETLVAAGVARVEENLSQHLAHPWVNYEIVLISRPQNFERVSPIVRSRQPHAVLIYDCEALFWRRMVRQATLLADDMARTTLEAAAAALRRLEEQIVIDADFAVTVSQEEASLLAAVERCCPMTTVRPVEPSAAFGAEEFHDRMGIAYVAGWLAGSNSPNGDGLRWFTAEILPLVRRAIPWVRVHVTGANPPAELVALSDPNLFFEGHVADLPGFYSRVRVVMAPIRFGAGVKVKTVQALQYGVPVVATSCGAEGIATHGLEAITVADSPHEFASALIKLLTDRPHWDARRSTIAELLDRWRNDAESGSWADVVRAALARRDRGRDALLAHR
jgi:hypothetical protein